MEGGLCKFYPPQPINNLSTLQSLFVYKSLEKKEKIANFFA